MSLILARGCDDVKIYFRLFFEGRNFVLAFAETSCMLLVNDNTSWKELTMTLDEKIKILEAARRGETIQNKSRRNVGRFDYYPNWKTFDSPIDENSFNFFVYDYRIAPNNALSITTRKGSTLDATANDDGSVTVGCETIEKKDVDAIFALRKGATS